jgi:hypothetical protein
VTPLAMAARAAEILGASPEGAGRLAGELAAWAEEARRQALADAARVCTLAAEGYERAACEPRTDPRDPGPGHLAERAYAARALAAKIAGMAEGAGEVGR